MFLLKTLAVTATIFAISFARAGELIDRKELFGNVQKKAAINRETSGCPDILTATLYTFGKSQDGTPEIKPVVGNSLVLNVGESDFGTWNIGPTFERFETPGDNGRILLIDPTDDLIRDSTILEALRNIDLQFDPDLRLALRYLGIKRVYDMLLEYRYRKPSPRPDLGRYVEMLFLSVKDIFQKSKSDNKKLLDFVTTNFYADDKALPPKARYKFLTAILAGIDVKEAVETDPKFPGLAGQWYDLHKMGMTNERDQLVELNALPQVPNLLLWASKKPH